MRIMNLAGAPGANLEQLQASLDQLGYTPDVILQEANFYDLEYSEAIEGVNPDARQWVRGSVWPVEFADENPATQHYLDNLAEFGPAGAEPALLGIHTWSAFLFFATLANECSQDGDLTRTCVFDKAKDTTEWDGGGLHPPTNPASNEPSECALLLDVVDGGFEIIWPPDAAPDQGADGYFCTDLARVEGDWGEGVVAGGG